jgi:hypothetical protein
VTTDPIAPTTHRPRWGVGRWAVVLVGAAALLAALTVGRDAVADEGCDGVQVVVDAAALGGAVTTRCAGTPSSGLDALTRAGHTYAFVPRVPGMVCTIDDRPDPCNGAPSDAYWSYWHAEAGGSWTYSTRGAGSRTPPPGTVEGWAFGAGDPPRIPPPAAAPSPSPTPSETASPSPSPTPTATASPTPSPTPTDGGATSSPGSGAGGEADPGAGAAGDGTADDGGSEADTASAGGSGVDGSAAADGDDLGGPGTTGGTDPAGGSPPRQRPDPSPPPAERRGAPETGRPPVELRAPEADEVAVGAPAGGDGAVGLIAGGAIAGTIAAAGVARARQRRRELDR